MAANTVLKGRGTRRVQEAESVDYLQGVGRKVRAARAQRGMTRKILARDSGVSERYLAQLEAGQGNPSILVVRQIAGAMDLPATALIDDGPVQPVDMQLAIQLLGRLSVDQQAEARRWLQGHFDDPGLTMRQSRIALIGLRGAGKSTLGKSLAARLAVPFIELNRVIEHDYGASLSELLSLSGQPAYRRYERRCLEAVTDSHDRAVIATGGSLVSEPGTLDLLLRRCLCIWIRALPEEHMDRVIAQGDLRPMADNSEAMADLRQILAAREPFYSKADATLDTANKSATESAEELVALVARLQGGTP